MEQNVSNQELASILRQVGAGGQAPASGAEPPIVMTHRRDLDPQEAVIVEIRLSWGNAFDIVFKLGVCGLVILLLYKAVLWIVGFLAAAMVAGAVMK
jgi:hypothetical protein